MEQIDITQDGRSWHQMIREAIYASILGESYFPSGADLAVYTTEGRVKAVMVKLEDFPPRLQMFMENEAPHVHYPVALLDLLDAPADPASRFWRDQCREVAERRAQDGHMDPVVWLKTFNGPVFWQSAQIEITPERSVDAHPHALKAAITVSPHGLLWSVEDHWMDTRDILSRGGAGTVASAKHRAEQELREIWQDIRRGSPVA